MRRYGLVLLVALVAGACSGSGQPDQPTGPPVTQLTGAPQAFDILKVAGLPCAVALHLVNGVAVCGPLGSTGITLSVAFYNNADVARTEFEKHCSGDTWNLYRDGQNWRGALSESNGAIPTAGARAIAAALTTDAIHGCGPGSSP